MAKQSTPNQIPLEKTTGVAQLESGLSDTNDSNTKNDGLDAGEKHAEKRGSKEDSAKVKSPAKKPKAASESNQTKSTKDNTKKSKKPTKSKEADLLKEPRTSRNSKIIIRLDYIKLSKLANPTNK